jgi:hypothetical protein
MVSGTPGTDSIISAEERIDANGALHSCETAAIKFFWLCMAFSVGLTAFLTSILERKTMEARTPHHMQK